MKKKKQNSILSANGTKKNRPDLMAGRYSSVIITFCLDLGFAFAAFWIARFMMFYAITPSPEYIRFEMPYMVVTVVVTVAMLVFFDCYNAVWKYAGRVEFLKFLIAYFASFIMMLLIKLVMERAFNTPIYMTQVVVYLVISLLLSGATRYFYAIVHYFKHVVLQLGRKDHKSKQNESNVKRTLIVGAGYTGNLMANRFINNPHEGYLPLAFVDDDPDKVGRKICGLLVAGTMEQIDAIVKEYKPDVFVIAIMAITKSELKYIYTKLAGYNLPVKVMPSMTDAEGMSTNALELCDIKIESLLGRDEIKVKTELMDISVKDKIVMVTGGAGSIGSELCRQALNFGCRHLVIFDQYENGMFELNEEFKKKYPMDKYSLVIGTVREPHKLDEALEEYKPNIVFHAAAYKHVPMMEISPTEAVKNNVVGTYNTVKACMAANVEKFILISTDKAVNPANVMGATKRVAEMIVETEGKKGKMQMAAVRFGNVLGSNGSVIPTFLRQIKDGGPITLTDKKIKRYFMTIPEAVRLVMQAGAFATNGEIFVLDMGEPVYIYDLACDLIRINGYTPETDIKIVVTGLRPGEKLFEELRYDAEKVDKTSHEGIFVTHVEDIDAKKFERDMIALAESAKKENEVATVKKLFEIVPSDARDKAQNERQESLKNADCPMEDVPLDSTRSALRA